MRLSPFRLHRPKTVGEAGELLSELGAGALPYCGGTELLLVAKLGLTDFTDLVDLKGIPELSGIEANGNLRIGATTTHREIERSPVVRSGWPSLAAMERQVANIRVRNVGSIGGNLCFADPHSDPATYLIAAGGSLIAGAGSAVRQISPEEFTRGPYETALAPEELLVAIEVPSLRPGSALVHRKLAFYERPAITVAASVLVRDGAVSEARLAVGSVGVTAQRLIETEQSLHGVDAFGPDNVAISRCAEIAAREAQPVEDANGSVQYKRQLVRVLVTRCVRDALADATVG
ncbi:MAG TPA: xanthine dehydrogenase family protein subunit M [Solirubrobacteraceae bacterium]|nr:xanthine dehydrogenase family protein subunit M [Solirubrobacteraceae bacterium]